MQAINDNLKELQRLNNERHEKFFAWIRNLITIAAGLIAVLVSLKSDKSSNDITHFLFVSTIGLLSFGILTGAIVLYHEVIFLDKAQTYLRGYILKLLRNKDENLLLETIEQGIEGQQLTCALAQFGARHLSFGFGTLRSSSSIGKLYIEHLNIFFTFKSLINSGSSWI